MLISGIISSLPSSAIFVLSRFRERTKCTATAFILIANTEPNEDICYGGQEFEIVSRWPFLLSNDRM